MIFTRATTFVSLFSASGTLAHMIMGSPVPYGVDTLNNSPLLADGSDFPCKQRTGVYEVTQENKLTAGKGNPLTFIGSAVHGGGSCQLSLTTDREPTKSSKFKVIASFIGGCPGISAPATFNYTIPDSVKNGEYTLAWTWFNQIGNREMYMNCAPVTVSGSSAHDDSAFNKLPDMFVANIGNGCSDTEGTDLQFPDPGSVVVKDPSAKPAPPVGNCAGGSGSASASPSEGSATPAVGSGSAVATSSSPSQTAGSSGGVFAPGASPAATTSTGGGTLAGSAAPSPTSTSTISTLLTVTASSSPVSPSGPASSLPASSLAPPAASPTPVASPSAAPSASGPATGGTSCSNEGGVVCSPDGSLFGLCNHGYAVYQILATGTTCQGGAVVAISQRALPAHRYNRRHR